MPELKPEQLLREWGGKSLRPVYYLSGEEEHGKAEALKVLAGAHDVGPFNRQDFRGESLDIEELLSVCQTQPMLAPLRITVVRRAEKLAPDHRKRLAGYLRDPLPTTCLVLVADEKRPEQGEPLSTLARSKGAVATFWALREAEALGWVRSRGRRAGVRLSEEAVQSLVEEIGTNLPTLEQELDKLELLVQGKKGEVGREEVLSSLGYRKAQSIYSLGRALQLRDARKAVQLARELREAGEEPLAMLSQASWTLSRQLRAKRLAAAGISGEAAFRELRVSSYYNKDFLEGAARTAEGRLLEGLSDCLETEARLKTGASSPSLELEGLLLRICLSAGASEG